MQEIDVSQLQIIFAVIEFKSKFAMTKEIVRSGRIWEKVADFLMDIAKYVLTAVIITSAFEELVDNKIIMYITSIIGAIIFFTASILILKVYKK